MEIKYLVYRLSIIRIRGMTDTILYTTTYRVIRHLKGVDKITRIKQARGL